MKNLLTASAIFFIFSTACIGQVPQTLSYQGVLTDASGTLVSGSHTVTFNFYTSSTGGTAVFSRGPLTVTTYQGLFTVILGNGQGTNNAGLPNLGSVQYYIGLRVDSNPSDLTPLVALTAVPYAFTASGLDASASISGSQVGAGINASNISNGTLDGSLVGVGINASNINSGTLSGSLVGTGINASNISNGTLDGSLVGTGIKAANITGTFAAAQIADGSVENAKLAPSGFDASKITIGVLPANVLPSGTGIPAGTIVAFAGSFAKIPDGWLECNGQSYSSAAPYDKLYAAIGAIWGSSDATHFNVPYLLGYFLRGWSHASGEDPDAATRVPAPATGSSGTGDAVGSYQQDGLKSHDHFQFVTAQESTYNVANSPSTSPITSLDHSTDGQGIQNSYVIGPHVVPGTRANTMPGSATGGNETRAKNAYVIYIIKY